VDEELDEVEDDDAELESESVGEDERQRPSDGETVMATCRGGSNTLTA